MQKYFIGLLYLILFQININASDFNEDHLKKDLCKFVTLSKHRTSGTPENIKAFEYLKQSFEKYTGKDRHVYVHKFIPDIDYAVKMYQQDFNEKIKSKFSPDNPVYKKWENFTINSINFVKKFKNKQGRNLILEFKGTQSPDKVLYIGAHYDTITHDHNTMEFTPLKQTQGADDNASAVISLLYIINYLSKYSFPVTIRFVAFDFEEIFFLGSYEFAKLLKQNKKPWSKKASNEKITGMIALEMLGWSHSNSNKEIVKIYTRNGNTEEIKKENSLADLFVEKSKDSNFNISFIKIMNSFDRSDHWSFWQWNFPALCISQDWEKDFNPNYHTQKDTYDRINYRYLSKLTKVIAYTLENTFRK